MRRHAEGLVILAGAPPGRAWSSPVRMVDVMRGAIAEVEDYARVSVATRSQAALAGSAVADVIHLLAELIENATSLSPPYTSVRVSGDTVANGFAIEVEDRGLGMSAQRLAELNERLASPPEFNPSDSEQLGLFVVSQLAKRHGIRVTLKASPYGGTAAIVLIPGHLVVTADAFRAGLPGERAAIGMAAQATNGAHAAAELAGPAGFLDGPELDGQGLPEITGIRISGPLRRSPDGTPEGADRGRDEAAGAEPVNGAAGYPDFDVFTPRRGSVPYADEPTAFPGWTGRSVAGGSVTPPAAAAPGMPGAGPATPMTPVASPRPEKTSSPPWELSRQTGPLPAIAVDGDPGTQPGGLGADGGVRGLPRRIRQASLAPQLRDDPMRRQTAAAPSAGPASGPTPAEIRQTMSALQRGWQEGRSQQMTAPSHGDAPFGRPSPGVVPPSGGDRRPAADEPQGKSDGT
jgi:hypothetical protein